MLFGVSIPTLEEVSVPVQDLVQSLSRALEQGPRLCLTVATLPSHEFRSNCLAVPSFSVIRLKKWDFAMPMPVDIGVERWN